MKFIASLYLILCFTSIYGDENKPEVEIFSEVAQDIPEVEILNVVPQNMSAAQKKKRYYDIIVPPVKKVHQELMNNYLRIKKNMVNKQNLQEIARLKRIYKVDNDLELLYALIPHPPSIVIAQGAIESAWATSRFYQEANNIFGMWSKNENEPRIAAAIMRNGNRTIWLRKFDSVEDSIRAYYRLMAKGKAFKEFRKTRYQTGDVHIIIKKLDKYSEIGDLYAEELGQMIRFNKLTKYDKV